MDNYEYERNLKNEGIEFIAGVDEVGRGPLVGPVVAACVVLPEEFNLDGLTDSKKLSEKKRDYFFEEIKKQALGYGIGIIDEKKIDEVNIYEATKLAMKEAISNLSLSEHHYNPPEKHIRNRNDDIGRTSWWCRCSENL